MSTRTQRGEDMVEVEEQEAALYRDGIIGLPGCFPPDWADELRKDFEAAFAEAMGHPGGTIGRGPHRYYFAVHPEQIRGFVAVLTHPSITRLCEKVLGPDYQFVELGFDVPLPGAVDQPWHRDFSTPAKTRATGRLTSIAFNLTTVDVTPELAPFEIATGTHVEDGSRFDHGMFPPPEDHERLNAIGSRRFPRRGDVSARTGLTLHRGTRNLTDRSRAVLILGVVSSDVPEDETSVHDLVLTRDYAGSLAASVRSHLRCTVVDELSPITQRHDIEGLMMGG